MCTLVLARFLLLNQCVELQRQLGFRCADWFALVGLCSRVLVPPV